MSVASTLPRGLRRFLRHYSNRAIIVDPSVAGEVYSRLLATLRDYPPVSAVSPIVFDPLISAWVSHVDTCVAFWRALFSSSETRRLSVPFFLYDLVASDYERITLWLTHSVAEASHPNDVVFPDLSTPLPFRQAGIEDSSEGSGDSDSAPGPSAPSAPSPSAPSAPSARAAGKRPQPTSPHPPVASSSEVPPPPKRSRVGTSFPPPTALPVLDPLMSLSAGDAVLPPVAPAGDPNRVCFFFLVSFGCLSDPTFFLLASRCSRLPLRPMHPI